MAHRDDDEDDQRGLSEIARAILNNGADYVDARVELARLEAEEAGEHFRGLSVRLGIGAFTATAGYTLCLVAGIALVGRHYFDGAWEIPAIIAGGLHLIIAALFLIGARRQAGLSSDLFGSTRRELIKDQLWLKQKSPRTKDEDARS
jgi:uncharacterized membrane protein YqjE